MVALVPPGNDLRGRMPSCLEICTPEVAQRKPQCDLCCQSLTGRRGRVKIPIGDEGAFALAMVVERKCFFDACVDFRDAVPNIFAKEANEDVRHFIPHGPTFHLDV